jgi:hypothetical protein
MAVVALLNAETLDGIQSQPDISVRVRARDTCFHLLFEAERNEMGPNYVIARRKRGSSVMNQTRKPEMGVRLAQ